MKVIFSPVVQNVLDNLYLKDSLKGRVPKFYNECFETLVKLDGTSNIIATIPKCWKGETIIKIRNLWFLYKKGKDKNREDCILVEEVFNPTIGKFGDFVTEQKNDKLELVPLFEEFYCF